MLINPNMSLFSPVMTSIPVNAQSPGIQQQPVNIFAQPAQFQPTSLFAQPTFQQPTFAQPGAAVTASGIPVGMLPMLHSAFAPVQPQFVQQPVLAQFPQQPVFAQTLPAVSQGVQTPTSQNSQLMNMMMQVMSLMTQVMSMLLNRPNPGAPVGSGYGAPVGGSLPGSAGASTGGYGAPVASANSLPGNAGASTGGYGAPVGGVYGGSTGVGASAPGSAGGATGGAGSSSQLAVSDFRDYFLAGSKGGTTGTNEVIEGRYADPNGRFANAGANEFDAVIAHSYAQQFKAYAMGLDVVFNPGDNVDQLAANLQTAQQTQFTPEAEILSKVAAVYRGDLTGVNAYDNAALKGLLQQWGRNDLAGQPGVGVTDVESIGSVVRALNEEQNGQTRQAWLQQIFDFQNNTPNSPSGAVPNVREYQQAINIVQSGELDQLLNNYQQGIKTGNGTTGTQPGTVRPVPGQDNTQAPGGAYGNGNTQVSADVDRNIDFTKLTKEQRTALGLNDRDRAVLHLWGRQVISTGKQDGGIYNNVLNAADTPDPNDDFTDAEEQLIRELHAKEMQQYGRINGKALDEEFFGLYERITGVDISQRYANRQENVSNGPINITSDVETLRQRTGLNAHEQAILRQWGHEPLMNGGKIDGSLATYTLGNANALDNPSKGGVGSSVDMDVEALLKADLTDDGVRNGSALERGFISTLDKIYGVNSQGASQSKTMSEAQSVAQANNRSVEQINQDVAAGMRLVQTMATQAKNGIKNAVANVADFVKDHPVATVAGTAGLVTATAVCPFMGGLGVGMAGIAMGQKSKNGY